MSLLAILVGMPGAGKTTVGRILASKIGVPFADSDRLISKKSGMAVSEIFASYGADFFRQLEHEVIADAVAHREGILSLGGGALLDPRTRELLAHERVIFIDASDRVLTARLRRSPTVRPVIGANIPVSLAQLRRKRINFYHQVASDIVVSDERSIPVVVERIMTLLERPQRIVKVNAPTPYDVVVGHDLVTRITRSAMTASHVFLIHSPHVTSFISRIDEQLTRVGLTTTAYELPDGENAKTPQVLAQLWETAGRVHLGRDAVVLGVGGGATTDVAGFFAATWMRGIRFVSVPTTLLGMVDAAVGGKTGINTEHGKNLVGSFWTPSHVICDLDVLATLSPHDMRSGLAEIAKCGFIADPKIVAAAEEPQPDLFDLVCRAIAVKAQIVGEDFREQGKRELLNYGHTLGHAIEYIENYQWSHGEAVAVGCVFAAALAVASDYATPEYIDRHRRVLKQWGLPTTYSDRRRSEVEAAMFSDKKVRDGKLRFVVVDDHGQHHTLMQPSQEALDFAWEQIQP